MTNSWSSGLGVGCQKFDRFYTTVLNFTPALAPKTGGGGGAFPRPPERARGAPATLPLARDKVLACGHW